jgi:hypothetical protein
MVLKPINLQGHEILIHLLGKGLVRLLATIQKKIVDNMAVGRDNQFWETLFSWEHVLPPFCLW